MSHQAFLVCGMIGFEMTDASVQKPDWVFKATCHQGSSPY